MAKTKIAWTHFSFNHVLGCTKVAPGCAHCYAEAFNKRTGKAKWGDQGTRIKTSEKYWREPLKWNREAEGAEERPRVFCASLADVFEDWRGPVLDHKGNVLRTVYPGPEFQGTDKDNATLGFATTLDHVRAELFRLIDATPNLDWLLLTKRPENIARMWPRVIDASGTNGELDNICEHRENVWLGASVSEQETFDRNAHTLYHECRELCPVLFLSAEPLLGPIKIHHEFDGSKVRNWNGCFDQVIIGCESSGPRVGILGAFKSEQDWRDGAEDIVRQCREANVACFVKQIPINGKVSHEPAEWIPELRVRQFPPAHMCAS